MMKATFRPAAMVRLSGTHMIPRGRDPFDTGAEGATAPETLRQKDRKGDEILESGSTGMVAPTEGVSRPSGEISQVR